MAVMSHPEREFSVMRRSAIPGVEILYAHFRRHEYPRHAHESATVALMDSGAATFRYKGTDFTARKGNVFLINADAVHTGRPADGTGYRYRVLYLDAEELRPLLADDADPPLLRFRQTIVQDPDAAELLRRTHASLAGGDSVMTTESLLLRLSWLLTVRYGGIPAPGLRGVRTRQVCVARDYLESHATEKVSLRDLARVALINPYDLARAFSTEMGMPPHAYQTQLRVRIARRLLASDIPAAEVAIRAGFCDQAHLGKVFKRYTGVTPRQFSLGAQGRVG